MSLFSTTSLNSGIRESNGVKENPAISLCGRINRRIMRALDTPRAAIKQVTRNAHMALKTTVAASMILGA
jgi:hypothetical protein